MNWRHTSSVTSIVVSSKKIELKHDRRVETIEELSDSPAVPVSGTVPSNFLSFLRKKLFLIIVVFLTMVMIGGCLNFLTTFTIPEIGKIIADYDEVILEVVVGLLLLSRKS